MIAPAAPPGGPPRQPFALVLRVAPPPAVYEGESFVKVPLTAGADLADLVEGACTKFAAHWRAVAGQVGLFLVSDASARAAQRDPASAAELLRGEALFPSELAIEGACYLARVPIPLAGNGGAAGGSSSLRERFCALLVGAGVVIDDRVMTTIASSGILSARVTMAATAVDACMVYESAAAVLHTNTRAAVRRNRGVAIVDEMLVPGA